MVRREGVAAAEALGPFHIHRGHDFEGFRIEERLGVVVLSAECECGEVLDLADAAFERCPVCLGEGAADCRRCGGTGLVIDHAALHWRLPDGEKGDDDADDT